jgi:hypothetical protein
VVPELARGAELRGRLRAARPTSRNGVPPPAAEGGKAARRQDPEWCRSWRGGPSYGVGCARPGRRANRYANTHALLSLISRAQRRHRIEPLLQVDPNWPGRHKQMYRPAAHLAPSP